MEYFRNRFIEELNDEGEVEIRGSIFTRQRVLEELDPDSYNNAFTDWVEDTKTQARDRAEVFLRANRCYTRFQTLKRYVHQNNVMPWVGAGMSASSGMPLWGNFLRSSCADGPDIIEEIEYLIRTGAYESAAQRVSQHMTPNILDEQIENTFGNPNPVAEGPIKLLPFLFAEGCVTTNFDYVLETVYRNTELGDFNHQIVGEQLREAPRRYAQDRHCLFRLHGEARQRAGRVLTQEEYDDVYDNEVILSDVLNGLIGQKNMLFLGCSLTVDRTLQALAYLKNNAAVQNPRHYAFLPLPAEVDRHARRLQLNSADIHPIWYPNDGEYDQHIEDLFIALMDGGA